MNDHCIRFVGITWDDAETEGVCEKSKSIVRTFVDDGHAFVQNLFISDTVAPVLALPSFSSIAGVSSISDLELAQCTDNCGMLSAGNVVDESLRNTTGQIRNVWTCKDLCGNEVTETHTIDCT